MKDELRAALCEALEAEPRVLALWECGSVSFGREDADSDLDLAVVVEDDAVEVAAQIVERVAAATRRIKTRWTVPTHGPDAHWQTFFQFEDASPLLQLDVGVIPRSSPSWMCEPEVHGNTPRVLFDRLQLLPTRRLDRAAHVTSLQRGIEKMRVTTALFHGFVDKELRRGRPIDAILFYNSFVLARLVEALRTLHCPQRATFGLRYLKEDLPAPAAQRVEALAFVGSPGALLQQKRLALAWLEETLDTLAGLDLAKHLDEKLAAPRPAAEQARGRGTP